MVTYCCVKGCSNNSNQKKKDPNALVSFHAFPSNQELKTKWLKAIGRPNWVPPRYARICSTHFNNEQINFEGCRIRIKDDSVPVNSLPVNSNFEASEVEACRICLATDVKLYNLQDSHLSSCMDSVAGFNDNYNIEGLPQYVCYQCTACLLKCYKLIEKSMTAQATLLDIFAKNGQITKNLIKRQNRFQLNLNSSLTCCPTINYYEYKYDEDSNISYKTSLESTDIYFKNENEKNNVQSDFKTDCNIETDLINDEMETAEYKISDEISNYNDDNLEDSSRDGSIDNNVSDNDTNEVEEKFIKPTRAKRKTLKRHEKSVRDKMLKPKANSLTPDETEMQKYFDIVPLSLQEQIEEWKRTAVRRPLTSETIYECEVCSKVFAHVNSYRIHVASHDASRGKVECPVCKLRFKSAVLAKSHANRAHGKKFYCKTCPKVFNNVGVAKKHHRWHYGYTYTCSSCPFRSAHESALGVHVRRAHARAYACSTCGRACVSARGLKLHAATAHRDYRDTAISKAYRCEECNINFSSEGARRVHLLTSSLHVKKTNLCNSSQSSELRNACKKCGVVCSSFAALVSHSRSQHPRSNRRKWASHDNYPTDCKLCGETLSCRRSHWQHVRSQHPKETDTYRPVVTAVCDTCGKGFQNPTKLQLHQLRHAAPAVRCGACARAFYDKYALARHAATHRAAKPHQCRTCGRAFKLKSNLHRHTRVHTDVTPYECTMCGKKFKYSTSVNLHIRTVHYKLPHPPRKKRSKSTKEVANDV